MLELGRAQGTRRLNLMVAGSQLPLRLARSSERDEDLDEDDAHDELTDDDEDEEDVEEDDDAFDV